MGAGDNSSNYTTKERGGTLVLGEGQCGHCGAYCVFKPFEGPSPARAIRDEWGDDEHLRVDEEFLFGVCPRPACQQTTVVRRETTTRTVRGDEVDSPTRVEVIFPRPRSARKSPSVEVPATLRSKYDEAGSIEFLSPTSAGFLAGRLIDQAIRHRLVMMKHSRRRVRKSTLADLIAEFVAAEKGNPELREMLTVMKDFRNIAAHPPAAVNEPQYDIDPSEAAFLLDCCAEVLEYVYARPARVAAMKDRLATKTRTQTGSGGLTFVASPPPPSPEFLPSDEDVPF